MALLEGHSTILYGDELFIFGGKDNKTGQLLNTVWRVSVSAATQAAAAYSAKHSNDIIPPNSSNSPARAGYAAELALSGAGAVATVVQTTGTPPTPRCYHNAVLRPPFMLVWGGTTLHPATVVGPRGERVSEATAKECIIFAFHLDTREWGVHVLQGKETRCPRPRCHASMVTTAHSVLFYGGYPNNHDEDTGTAHIEPNHWSVFEVGADAYVRSNARSGSEVPMLWGQSAVFAHGCLCVFGGVDFATMTETNALCLFSLEEKRWRWAEFALAPEARALHSAVLHGSNMFVYGGFTGRPDRTDNPTFNDVWRFSLNTGLWDECNCSGFHPPARSGHSSVVAQNHMIVVGGLEGNKETLPDHSTLAVLDLHSFQWTQCPILFPAGGADVLGLAAGQQMMNSDHHAAGNSSGDLWGGLSAGTALKMQQNHNPNSPGGGNNASGGKNNNLLDSPSGRGGSVGARQRTVSAFELTPQGQGGDGSAAKRMPPSASGNPNALGAQMLKLSGNNGGGAGGVRRVMNQQEQALMDAAAPPAFGSGNNAAAMSSLMQQQQQKKAGGSAGGGIPSAIPSASNNNNTNANNASRSSTPGGAFAASLQQQLQQQQQQQNASRTPSAFSPYGGAVHSQARPNASGGLSFTLGGIQQEQQYQQQPTTMFSPMSALNQSLSPPREHYSPTGSYDYNNNNNGSPNNNSRMMMNNDPRSASNVLLSNLHSADRRALEQQQADRASIASMQAEQQQLMREYQEGLARQAVFQASQQQQQKQQQQQQEQSASPNNNNNASNKDDLGDGEMAWARSATPPTASRGALEAARKRNLNRTPPRPDGGGDSSPDSNNNSPPTSQPRTQSPGVTMMGGFAPAGQHVAGQAAQLAAQQAAMQAMNGPPPENLPVFGVRPVGGLGRSASVGLGMPPAMIDVMGGPSQQQQQLYGYSISPSRAGGGNAAGRSSPGRQQSPNRSASASSLRSILGGGRRF